MLGPLEVVGGGGAVAVPGPRQRGLLAALLASANQVMPAERLVEELWGDRPPPSAATALQVNVSRLRRVLGAAGGGDGAAIVTRRPGYLLRVEPDDVDALRFERLAARGRAALVGGDLRQAAEDLGAAAALWRGPALGEFPDQPSVQSWRARLDRLRLAAIEGRIDADLALGRHHEVVDELYQLVEAEPLRERLWAQLMLALYRAGRQGESLRAFTRLRAVLDDELGIEPGPDLKRLEEQVLLQKPELDWKPPARSISTGPAPGATGRRRPPLVGREPELRALAGHLDSALRGEGRVVLVRGEPGIGKTRLAEELASMAEQRAAAVLWGRCVEDAGTGPYWPWAEALRGWLGTAQSGGPEAFAADRPYLAQVLPELADEAGGPPALLDVEPDDARIRLFTAVGRCLLGLGAGSPRPTVVLLDDLQWADVASLLLLQHLSRAICSAPVLVLATYRDVELGRDHPLTATLGELARHEGTERLALGGLSAAEVGRMIEVSTGQPSGALAAAVYRRTEGNPFFVREVLRLLDAEHHLAHPQGPDAGIPEGVREVVDRRCARLSTPADRLLRVAAVVGREFRVDVVEALWTTPEPVLELLEEAEAGGFVSADKALVGCYRFSHDIVRETLYDQISPVRRARLHGRIGTVLGRSAGHRRDDAAAIAYHLLLGIPGGVDPGDAVEHAIRAAGAAMSSLAYEEAVEWCDRALAVAAGDEALRLRVLLVSGAARWRAGDVPGARRTFLEAAEVALGRSDPEMLAEAVLGFGGGAARSWHATRGAFGDRPLRLLEEALARIGPGDHPRRAQLLGLLAEELYYLPADQRRDQLTAEAVGMARRLGDRAALAAALSSRWLAVWGPDHLDERLRVAREIVSLAEQLGDCQLLFFGYQYVFVALMEGADVAAARSTLDLVERSAENLRQPLARWEARRYRAMLAIFEGDFPLGEQLALEALALGQGAGEPDATAVFGVQLAVVRFEQGRLAEVEPALEDFAREFAESPVWRAALGLIKAELGRDEEARAELDMLAVDGFSAIPRNFAWLAAMAMLAQLSGFFPDAGHAAILADLLAPFAGRNVLTGDRQAWGSVCRYLGLLALSRRDLDQAEHWFERAIEENARMGSPPWAAYSQCELAETLLVAGEAGCQARAGQLAAEAAATAERLGMARLLRAAERTCQWARGDTGRCADARPLTMRPWTPRWAARVSIPAPWD